MRTVDLDNLAKDLPTAASALANLMVKKVFPLMKEDGLIFGDYWPRVSLIGRDKTTGTRFKITLAFEDADEG